MNREILFRGKREDGLGNWVYGYLIIEPDGNNWIDHYPDRQRRTTKVIPESVGQFTGLTDKNGVKIFEGDKVKMVGSMVVYVVEYKFASFWMTGNHYSTILDAHDCRFEVIGNIHDTIK